MIAERLRALVEAESPSGDRERIGVALDLLRGWGDAALARRGELVSVDGVDHLYWRAARRPSVLLLGHADTVWHDGWPFTVDGDIARGPGIFDMKAGLIAMLAGIERVADPAHVALLITTDEEVGSTTSRALIESAARVCDAVLVGEPSLDGALKTARCGAGAYRVRFTGLAAHAGLDPEKGASALVELARHVLSVGELADGDAGTTVTPTLAWAGTTMNTVAGEAELNIDVRGRTLGELQRVHERITTLRPFDRRVVLAVEGGINRPPLEAEQSRELFDLAQTVAAMPLAGAAVSGASDGNFTAACGVATLDGLGALGGGAHARTEWVSLRSIDERATLIAALVDLIAVREKELR